jgi:hypothetical protein
MSHLYRVERHIQTGPLKHFEISVGKESLCEEDFFRLDKKGRADYCRIFRKAAKDYLERNMRGFWGGVIFFHPWRRRHMDGSECKRKDCHHKHQWVWGPHFHFVGYGRMREYSAAYCLEWERVCRKALKKYKDAFNVNCIPGLVYEEDLADNAPSIYHENIGFVFSYKQLKAWKGSRKLKETCAYELTHVGLFMEEKPLIFDYLDTGEVREVSGANVYHFVGAFANCKGGKTLVSQGMEAIPCSDCGGTQLEFEVDPVTGKPTKLKGTYSRWTKYYAYHLTEPKKRSGIHGVKRTLSDWTVAETVEERERRERDGLNLRHRRGI